MAGRRRVRSAREASEQIGEAARVAPVRTARRATDKGEQVIAKAEAQQSLSDDLKHAMAMAQAGDDSLLMPYQPSPSINPPRPRTKAFGYDEGTQTLFVRFRDGAVYAYYEVEPREFRNFKRVKSPGRAINRTIGFHAYARLW